VPEHHREQPDDARDPGLVGELDPELGEVHLRLAAGRGLEPPLEDLAPRRPRRAQDIGEDAVAARVAQIAYSDEAGHAFRSDAGHLFQFHSGRDSDLKPATFSV
jgi:hypothetical protein